MRRRRRITPLHLQREVAERTDRVPRHPEAALGAGEAALGVVHPVEPARARLRPVLEVGLGAEDRLLGDVLGERAAVDRELGLGDARALAVVGFERDLEGPVALGRRGRLGRRRVDLEIERLGRLDVALDVGRAVRDRVLAVAGDRERRRVAAGRRRRRPSTRSSSTPEPPALSVASRVTSTSPRNQPFSPSGSAGSVRRRRRRRGVVAAAARVALVARRLRVGAALDDVERVDRDDVVARVVVLAEQADAQAALLGQVLVDRHVLAEVHERLAVGRRPGADLLGRGVVHEPHPAVVALEVEPARVRERDRLRRQGDRPGRRRSGPARPRRPAGRRAHPDRCRPCTGARSSRSGSGRTG